MTDEVYDRVYLGRGCVRMGAEIVPPFVSSKPVTMLMPQDNVLIFSTADELAIYTQHDGVFRMKTMFPLP